jgi:hypothetical protein
MRFLPILLMILIPFAQAQDAPDALRQAIKSHLEERGEKTVPPFRYALADLDGDKQDDALALLVGPFWCGTGGCTMLVFRAVGDGYKFVSDSSVTREPIRVSTQTSHGWYDLIVGTKGTGDVLMQYDGQRYPSDPSTLAPATPTQIAASRIVLGE